MNSHVILWIIRECPYARLPYDKQACSYCDAAPKCKAMPAEQIKNLNG